MSNKPPVDPWEARERERERWNNPRRSRRGSSRAPDGNPVGEGDSLTSGLGENYLIFGILASVILLSLAEIPRIPADSRMIFAEAGALLPLLLLGICRSFVEDMRIALRRGLNPLILLLVAWACFAFFNSPYRTVAAADLLRVVSGAAIYFLVAYTLKTPRQKSGVLIGVLALGIVVSLIDLAQAGRRGEYFSTNDFSIFGTHGNVGSLLVLLVPAALSFALHTDIEEKRRLAALAAAIILSAALLVSRTRSAWIGAVFAFITLTYLFLRYGPKAETKKRGGAMASIIGSPITMITLGFLVFALVGGLAPLVTKRAASVTKISEDVSFQTRLNMWNGAALMAAEKPLTGWGLGSFQVLQSLWTHDGDEPFVALQLGTDQRNMAHNYYFQWGADAGSVGLILYGATLTLFLLSVFRGAGETRTPFQMALLAGATASAIGGIVDACASPAYNFHGVHAVFWLWIGMGVSALRPYAGRDSEPTGPALRPTPWTHWTGAILSGAFLAAIVLGSGYVLRSAGQTAPRGRFEIIAADTGPMMLGVPVSWTAVFTDSTGQSRPTYPGTLWQLQTDAATTAQTQAQTDADPAEKTAPRSRFKIQLPILAPPTGPVTIHATYRDRFGRVYEANSEKRIMR